jgi:MFS superfamily sulfate permease-like transporter
LGDLGTFIPLLVGMVTKCGLQLGPALFFAGLMNVITGVVFGIPVCIQPMKAIAAVAITERMNESQIIAAGIITGFTMLLLVASGLVDRLQAGVPKSVVRGLQLALGLKLLVSGIRMVVETSRWSGPDSITVGMVCVVIAIVLRRSTRLPASLAIFTVGLMAMGWPDLWKHSQMPVVAWHLPNLGSLESWSVAFWRASLPQIPLTMLNSGVAVCALSADLFPRRLLSQRNVALSVGLMNVAFCPFGAMPMCHGAGGLAAQYRFGARSGGSLMILGLGSILLALLLGNSLLAWLEAYPQAVLGVLLGYGGLQLALVCRDQTRLSDITIMLVTMTACCVVGIATGVLIGWLVTWVAKAGCNRTVVD